MHLATRDEYPFDAECCSSRAVECSVHSFVWNSFCCYFLLVLFPFGRMLFQWMYNSWEGKSVARRPFCFMNGKLLQDASTKIVVNVSFVFCKNNAKNGIENRATGTKSNVANAMAFQQKNFKRVYHYFNYVTLVKASSFALEIPNWIIQENQNISSIRILWVMSRVLQGTISVGPADSETAITEPACTLHVRVCLFAFSCSSVGHWMTSCRHPTLAGWWPNGNFSIFPPLARLFHFNLYPFQRRHWRMWIQQALLRYRLFCDISEICAEHQAMRSTR